MPLPLPLKRSLDAVASGAMRSALRVSGLGDGPRHHVIEASLQSIDGMNRGLKVDLLQFDPQLLWALKPHAALKNERVDERGMMNGPFAMAGHPEARPIRLLILGTSNFIVGTPSLFVRLRERVEAARPDIQLINASVPGYSSAQILHYYSRLAPFYRPTHLIACSVWPDCWPRTLVDDATALRVMAAAPWRGGFAPDRLGRALMYARWRLRHDGPRVTLGQYTRRWHWLARLARAHGCQAAFFHYPVFFDIPPLRRFLRLHHIPWLAGRYERYREAFLALARRYPMCDCSAALSDAPERFYESDGQHLNDGGLERIADSLARFITGEFVQ